MSDVTLLTSLLSETPTDRTAWLALADALRQAGRDDEADLIQATERVAIEDGDVVEVPTYRLDMRCEGGGGESERFDTRPTDAECDSLTDDWTAEGEWGDEGASVDYWWTLYAVTSEGEEEVAEGRGSVEIEPDHDAMIRAAGGDADCDHEWTSEGEGGCRENPGVWSTGGTSMSFASHCRACGLHRNEYSCGSQRNPGERDTVSYEQPDNWCVECQSDDCECETDAE